MELFLWKFILVLLVESWQYFYLALVHRVFGFTVVCDDVLLSIDERYGW